MKTNAKLFLLQLLAGLILAAAGLLSSCNSRPDCTIRETGPGMYEPWGDCDDCTQLSVIGLNGAMRPMAPSDMEQYVRQYPPSASFNPASPSLSDFMLYHYLLSGPRATHYQTVYVNQSRGYTGYRRTHPSWSYGPRTRTAVINRTTVINNRTIVNNRPSTTTRRPSLWNRISSRPTTTSSYSSSRTTTRTTSRPYSCWSRPSSGFSKSYSSSKSASRTSYTSSRRR
ncbi:hypothetical protein FAES_3952 [Fibrella aestuarina BUZ 2]|uniref:Lipoprotein n=1 Tax=Fibrella aestuarina BUZ 2 TaxID=1166018 RepID=I0KCV2_9BACT|nr:hypothetical protein [Fibrella aestuarina]CCH01955.1 hypothetical protein FAES_3952 [Fibrella aestuarina BUZ 2]